MRTFIAIALDEKSRQFLSGIQQQLKSCGADVKWVEPHNIHVTLKFLGEIDEDVVSRIKPMLNSLASKFGAFRARISSIGAFPRLSSPRVIWAAMEEGAQEIKQIAAALEQETEGLGIPREKRPFSSHITIGRTRSGLNMMRLVQRLKDISGGLPGGGIEFTANRITLFKSTLSPSGPTYEPLHEAYLKTS